LVRINEDLNKKRDKTEDLCLIELLSLNQTLGHCGLTTSNVLKTNCIRLATTDGFSEVPVTAICSSCKVFTGNHAIPLT